MSRIVLTLLLCAGLLSLHSQEDAITHRRNFRRAFAENPDAAIAAGLADADCEIRRYAVYQDFLRNGLQAVAGWEKLLQDPDQRVQLAVVDCLAKLPADNPLRQTMGQALVDHSEFPAVAQQAMRLDAQAFNFFRNNILLKDDPTFDHVVEVKDTFAIPDDQWRMATDPAEIAHTKDWFAPGLDESGWTTVKCGPWEDQGFANYDGVAWYRIHFTAPPSENFVGANLKFGAVDEQAWVWLNGKYIGQHVIGPDGWDVPFWLNVGDEILWGAENLLVVRVEDSKLAGGIWKPIELQTLISK